MSLECHHPGPEKTVSAPGLLCGLEAGISTTFAVRGVRPPSLLVFASQAVVGGEEVGFPEPRSLAGGLFRGTEGDVNALSSQWTAFGFTVQKEL